MTCIYSLHYYLYNYFEIFIKSILFNDYYGLANYIRVNRANGLKVDGIITWVICVIMGVMQRWG